MTACDQADNLFRAGAESGWAFAGVENPQAPGGARADVNQAAAVTERVGDAVNQLCNLRNIRRDGVSNLLIFIVNDRQHLFGGEGVNVGAVRVAPFSQQFAQVDIHRKPHHSQWRAV